MSANDNEVALLIRKLERLARLEQADKEALRGLPLRTQRVPADHYLVQEGDVALECCVLLKGYACRHKMTRSGDRQVVSFHVQGDILDLQNLLLSRADHSVQTVSPATIGVVPSSVLKDVADRHPRIKDALWRETLIEAAVFREWVLNVGRRNAIARISHMLCEFALRSQQGGISSPEATVFPFTQDLVADATGLSVVHTNRVIQELRASGALRAGTSRIEIGDWEKLLSIGEFDPHYLHAAA